MSNSFQGQTDQILAIKLASSILSARWLDAEVAVNGETGLEVRTAFVGDTAPIKITIKDQSGASAGSLDGVILSNLFRARWKPGAKNAGKTLAFEAELSKHGLEKGSGPLKAGPIVNGTTMASATAHVNGKHHKFPSVPVQFRIHEEIDAC